MPSKHRIFCYGDSLTAGTSPPSLELFPYGVHLEQSLDNAVVRWLGFPGRTASSMAKALDAPDGLRDRLRKIAVSGKASLAVILAGTNDLGYELDSESIFKSLKTLHEAAHDEGVPTVAVSIPPSSWQAVDRSAKALAEKINESLRQWALEKDDMVTYVPCPIQSYNGRHDERFCDDGLHFTPEGYRLLGTGLAPDIQKILNNLSKT